MQACSAAWVLSGRLLCAGETVEQHQQEEKMITVFQIEVAPEDEAVFDDLFGNKLAEIVNLRVDRFGALETVHILKGDVQGSTNTYIVIAGINGLGFSFSRAFKDIAFPASMKISDVGGAYHQLSKWPDKAVDIEP